MYRVYLLHHQLLGFNIETRKENTYHLNCMDGENDYVYSPKGKKHL